MAQFRLNEQILFLRKQKGMTQEELANALGVSNQAVSKWEAAQCCPDIALLADIAKLFDVSIDELMGYKREDTLNDISLQIRRNIGDVDDCRAAEYALQAAYAAHAAVLSKIMNISENTVWSTDEAFSHAGKGEWGFSNLNMPKITTVMCGGTVLFSNNSTRDIFRIDPSVISRVFGDLADTYGLIVLTDLYTATVGDENRYISAEEIAKVSGRLDEQRVKEILEPKHTGIYRFINEKDGKYRIKGSCMHILPLITLLANL